ncbi:MAG: hypothetical protein MJK04_36095 [Psychrosphaera sp.]|nr:hypothetical protein [Psychrosphaera sp.]
MKIETVTNKTALLCALITLSMVSLTPAQAGTTTVDNINITEVWVNGGTDTANPGVTCVRISGSAPAACASGFIAIPNNNKELISVALAAKTTKSNAWIFFNDSGNYHCPGLTFTACSVISIAIK